MKTLREFFLDRLNVETPYFVNMLKALPADRLDYKPHERSQSAHQIAWLMACEMETCVQVATEFKAEWNVSPPAPIHQVIEKFETSAKQLAEMVGRMEEGSWDRKAQFYYQGKMVWETTAGYFFWYILFDAIHHRGQLSAYVRSMGGKVPAIYGPSADEKDGMM